MPLSWCGERRCRLALAGCFALVCCVWGCSSRTTTPDPPGAGSSAPAQLPSDASSPTGLDSIQDARFDVADASSPSSNAPSPPTVTLDATPPLDSTALDASVEDTAPKTALQVSQPSGWADDLALTVPEDLNPDPHILEVAIEARIAEIEFRPGFLTPAWTYNGTVPGPLLRAEVGDTLIVHFKNLLPEETSVHWHGVRVPNNMDGVPGVTQPAILPGDEFRYEFVLRDAGTYWYHPHSNSAHQVGWGLYAPMVVEDPNDPEEFGDDLVLMLSDMSLDDAGQFIPSEQSGEFGKLFGMEGEVLLVNGKVLPRLKVRQGKQQRWRIINACRSRYYTLGLPGHTLTRLGGDNGLAQYSTQAESVIIVPAERQDVVFTPSDPPGTERALQWVATERGFGSTFNRPNVDMMRIETVAEPAVLPEPLPEQLRAIPPIDTDGAVELGLDLTIVTNEADGTVVMGINGIPYWDVQPIVATLGQTHVWTLTNQSDFAHPFHLHGYFFQVLDETRVPEWKDTVDVPVDATVKIAVVFDERPGMWMYHCHILDHAEAGMMGHLHVQ